MTKLMEWLFVLFTGLAIYVALLHNQIESAFLAEHRFSILITPLILIAAFGIYSVFTILYRVFTFNDCAEAADEIQRQIKEARADLESKGFVFTKTAAAS